MKIVISPAKTLDYKSELPTSRATQPPFLDTTAQIARKLERMSRRELSDLLGVSDKLAALNYDRYREFQADHTGRNSRPAVYAFAGEVYTGLDAYSISQNKLDRLQDTLRILSGLYGILRPLDLIQPYRLEMGIPLTVGRKKDLYQVWKGKVTSFLNQELKEGDLLLNLASQEYFRAVDSKKLKVPVITPTFRDYRDGELKTIVLFTKKARGAMARYVVDSAASSLEEITAFEYEGYRFSPEETRNPDEPVFTR